MCIQHAAGGTRRGYAPGVRAGGTRSLPTFRARPSFPAPRASARAAHATAHKVGRSARARPSQAHIACALFGACFSMRAVGVSARRSSWLRVLRGNTTTRLSLSGLALSLSLSSAAAQPASAAASFHSSSMASKRIPPNVVIRGSKAAPPPTATVILMHGLGDTADGWVDAAEFMARSLPHVQFVLPTATKEPVTVNGNMHMPSWYDIETLGSAKLDRTHEGECKGIEFSRDRILGLVEESVKAGIPYSRIVLSGFSQGGMFASSPHRCVQHARRARTLPGSTVVDQPAAPLPALLCRLPRPTHCHTHGQATGGRAEHEWLLPQAPRVQPAR
ncbi:hypothetical protein EON67_01845 [archaeon]|nr:MAG: hypothetical protein EON67_01845 [archaeon]